MSFDPSQLVPNMPFVICYSFRLFPTIDPLQAHFHCSAYDEGATWGLKCLTYNRHMPTRPATYKERRGYVYDEDACGQGVTMYILGMSSSFLSFCSSCCDTGTYCGDLLDERKSESSRNRYEFCAANGFYPGVNMLHVRF